MVGTKVARKGSARLEEAVSSWKRTGSVGNRKAILLYTTESIQITQILKSGLDAVVKSPFATDDDDCYIFGTSGYLQLS